MVDVRAVPLPQLDAVTDEGMAKIVDTRRGVTAAGHPTDLCAKPCKDPVHRHSVQSFARSGYKKMLPDSTGESIAQLAVAHELGGYRWMQVHLPRLAVLRLSNRQPVLRGIKV